MPAPRGPGDRPVVAQPGRARGHARHRRHPCGGYDLRRCRCWDRRDTARLDLSGSRVLHVGGVPGAQGTRHRGRRVLPLPRRRGADALPGALREDRRPHTRRTAGHRLYHRHRHRRRESKGRRRRSQGRLRRGAGLRPGPRAVPAGDPRPERSRVKDYDDKRQLLETMLEIRAFDEKVDELYAEGALHGTAHFYVGQEAVAVGGISTLQEGDVITGTHRGHGHAVAFGLDLDRMAAELLGKASGYCHGKGGSMHIADVGAGMLGANGIVGGSMGIACGAGWAFKRRGQDHAALCFFGEGAANEGIFHEALNLAAIWKLPVVFLCENNQYGMSMSVKRATAIENISDRAAAYGMPGVTVAGTELDEVYKATLEALERARAGEGPTLLEAITYRYLGHSKSDANLYRTREEISTWRKRDPIERFAAVLEGEGVLQEGEWRTLEEQVKERIE